MNLIILVVHLPIFLFDLILFPVCEFQFLSGCFRLSRSQLPFSALRHHHTIALFLNELFQVLVWKFPNLMLMDSQIQNFSSTIQIKEVQRHRLHFFYWQQQVFSSNRFINYCHLEEYHHKNRFAKRLERLQSHLVRFTTFNKHIVLVNLDHQS